jgi:cytochrome b subunit of formate dehydrogenase
VLGTVIRWNISQKTLFVFGVVFSITVALAGIIITRFYEEK